MLVLVLVTSDNFSQQDCQQKSNYHQQKSQRETLFVRTLWIEMILHGSIRVRQNMKHGYVEKDSTREGVAHRF